MHRCLHRRSLEMHWSPNRRPPNWTRPLSSACLPPCFRSALIKALPTPTPLCRRCHCHCPLPLLLPLPWTLTLTGPHRQLPFSRLPRPVPIMVVSRRHSTRLLLPPRPPFPSLHARRRFPFRFPRHHPLRTLGTGRRSCSSSIRSHCIVRRRNHRRHFLAKVAAAATALPLAMTLLPLPLVFALPLALALQEGDSRHHHRRLQRCPHH